MIRFPIHLLIISIVPALLMVLTASAQQTLTVNGRVFDISQYRPLEAVSVLSNSGAGTSTDSLGRFRLSVSENDSIWFSYLNRPTPKYAVKTIRNRHQFEISLHVQAEELKEVSIAPPDYRLDSIRNRQDYAKAFNFRKPGFGTSINPAPGGGVGLDINELIGMFQFRKNRRMLAFQERLIQEEEDRFIDHRFSRALVIRLTMLSGNDLNDFMQRYRPSLQFVTTSTDYELQDYIKKSFSHYQRYRYLMKKSNEQ